VFDSPTVASFWTRTFGTKFIGLDSPNDGFFAVEGILELKFQAVDLGVPRPK
jgi:hypothetical protein